ncbi:Alpha-L-arabinofuranosidase [Chitinophaga sp. CF118]|uniref:cellulase family glycosylhydrolase n=1 Tax=Chitinophaga sp. CF118 TaxID=1884367 RepID=UPI0008E2C5AC|nr:cellulase family glycosylhydrolase [Chitinophaga sp. CF118]SFF09862.1 Alpha-L-arabinofuranosidase [Chitinophaga sp. CF118]
MRNLSAISVLFACISINTSCNKPSSAVTDPEKNALKLAAATATSITVNCSSNEGAVNPLNWGVGAPDKYMWWPGNTALQQRISDAKIKIVRVGPVQLGNYNGRDMYPAVDSWNFTDMDKILNSIFDAGAQPSFTIVGYPKGVAEKDWAAYAHFMEGVIKRYNVQKALGDNRTVKYWEMWNESTNEGDGILNQTEYKAFVQTVGNALKAQDPTIKLIGPAHSWSDLGTGGWVSFAAKELESQLDILSWHDYGPDPVSSDAERMNWQKEHYYDKIIEGRTGGIGGALTGPSGKKYGAAITEYNMSHADGGSTYNLKYHSEFNATYAGSAIINALKAKADLFLFYNLSETGTNLLGLLDNSSFAPYKPYYTIYLFGNYTGTRALTATGGATSLDYYASKDTVSGKYYLTLVNKSVDGTTFNVTVNLSNISGATGTVKIRKVDASTNPTSNTSISYSTSKFTYSIAPYSVVSFEVAAATGTL